MVRLNQEKKPQLKLLTFSDFDFDWIRDSGAEVVGGRAEELSVELVGSGLNDELVALFANPFRQRRVGIAVAPLDASGRGRVRVAVESDLSAWLGLVQWRSSDGTRRLTLWKKQNSIEEKLLLGRRKFFSVSWIYSNSFFMTLGQRLHELQFYAKLTLRLYTVNNYWHSAKKSLQNASICAYIDIIRNRKNTSLIESIRSHILPKSYGGFIKLGL